MTGRVKVQVWRGGSYAPCAYLYRIKRDDLHDAAMDLCVANGMDDPRDDGRSDNVLLDDVDGIVPARHMRDLDEGWTVTFLLDRWEAFAYYGWDCGDTLG